MSVGDRMRDNWTDFEKYVFERLEENRYEHSEIKLKIAVVEERIKPRKTVQWKIGLGAVIVTLVAAAREIWK